MSSIKPPIDVRTALLGQHRPSNVCKSEFPQIESKRGRGLRAPHWTPTPQAHTKTPLEAPLFSLRPYTLAVYAHSPRLLPSLYYPLRGPSLARPQMLHPGASRFAYASLPSLVRRQVPSALIHHHPWWTPCPTSVRRNAIVKFIDIFVVHFEASMMDSTAEYFYTDFMDSSSQKKIRVLHDVPCTSPFKN